MDEKLIEEENNKISDLIVEDVYTKVYTTGGLKFVYDFN